MTYTADDLVVVGQVSLAVLAAVDALGVQVDVVGEAHLAKGWGLPLCRLESTIIARVRPCSLGI